MSQEFINYVGGFLFSKELDKVVLIIKNKPDFLKGKLNPVGGKVEQGESNIEAIIREFKEEAGAEIYDWKGYTTFSHRDFAIHYFVSVGDLGEVRQVEDEVVYIENCSDVLSPKNKFDDTFRGAYLQAVNYIYKNYRKEVEKEKTIDKYKEHKAWYNMQKLYRG